MTTAAGIAPKAPALPSQARDDKADAARQLEAFFLRRLLAEARPTGTDPLMGGGFAGETFKEMLDDQLADRMAAAGGVGLASVIGAQLGADPAALEGRPPALSSIADLERRIARAPTAPALDTGVHVETTSDLVLPAIGRRSSPYGMRLHPIDKVRKLHAGMDIAAPTGTPVSAAAAGLVIHAGPAGGYGNVIKIRHDNGLETRYAHLSAMSVKKGDRVGAGAPIGAVGTTGHSTGPHLHFEVRKSGKPLDPLGFLPDPDPPLDPGPSRPNR